MLRNGPAPPVIILLPEQGRVLQYDVGARGPRSCPFLLTRFQALPQQLVKVTASVKIKEMHAAFMGFLCLFSSLFWVCSLPHPLSVFPQISPTVKVKVLCDTQFGLMSHCNPVFIPSVFLLTFSFLPILSPLLWSPPDMVYSIETLV